MNIPKYIVLLFLFNGLLAQSQSLKEYRWKNRVIILVDGKNSHMALQKQYKAIAREESALRERDLIIFLLKGSSVELATKEESYIDGSSIRKELKIDDTFEGVILVGKDGGVKFKKEFHVKPQIIFDVIDAMPMRKAEMKN